jgi:type III pantothenate kinase
MDIGNTRIKWGVLRDGQIGDLGDRVHRGRGAVAAAAVVKAMRGREFRRTMVSNVAGNSFATNITRAVSSSYGIEPTFAHVGRQKLGIRCGYRDPKRLGVDRWLAVLAAHKTAGRGALVIDAGTTLTIDGVTADGVHLGGLIIPGPQLMARALRRETSDIGDVAVTRDARSQTFLGRSTSEAVNMGSGFALAGAVDQALRFLKRQLGNNPRVLVTGGDGADLVRSLKTKAELRPALVLEGLALFAGEGLA